ncbi:MAG TPA: YfiR family protein [Verrucomicrobiae bacterium]|jgi:hypothetical protein
MLLLLLTVQSRSVAAPSQISREYQLKAVFLFNFAQFTEWPTNTFATSNAPIVIGVMGIDPFGSVLDDTIRGETINGRKLVVERYRRVEEIGTCHILFISQSENRRVEQILDRLKGKPVLTVGDMDASVGRHVAIRFVEDNNRLQIHINPDAVAQSHLTLSSKLLRAAGINPSEKAP